MPETTAVATPAPETESTEVSIADYRKERAEPSTAAATTPEKTPGAASKPAPESASGQPESKTPDDKGADKDADKPKGGWQRRIDKLTKEKSDLERQNQDLAQRITALEQKNPAAKTEAAAGDDPEPKEDDFKEYRDYVKALARWTTRQEQKAAAKTIADNDRKAEETEAQQRAKEEFDAYQNALPAAEETHADFRELLSDPELMLPNYIQLAIVQMADKGPEAAYQLAKDFKASGDNSVLAKILADNERGKFSLAMVKFGAFVSSLEKGTSGTAGKPGSPEPAKRPVTQAPTPITPVGSSGGATEVDPDKIESVSEWRRQRAAGKIR